MDADPEGEDSKMDSSGGGAGADDSDELHVEDKDGDVMVVDEIVEDVNEEVMDVEDGNVASDEHLVEALV